MSEELRLYLVDDGEMHYAEDAPAFVASSVF